MEDNVFIGDNVVLGAKYEASAGNFGSKIREHELILIFFLKDSRLCGFCFNISTSD